MFSFATLRQTTPVLSGGDLVLRCPRQSDYPAWHALRLKSRDFLIPYEPRWTESDLSARLFSARVRRGRREALYGTEYSFLVFGTEGRRETLLGGLTLSNIRRRASQNVTLGYWMGVDHAGKGTMTRSVALVLPFVFDTLGLHRIEAACLPDNIASRRVLESNGFREIGLAENYLQINGAWRDHVLFGLPRERYENCFG